MRVSARSTYVRDFSNKTIVLGITGSIAAYKACELASRLVERGANVLPVLTRAAREFLGPATLEGITGNRTITDMFDAEQNPDIAHISVARAASLFMIAPATAHIIAKMAHGLADDWLTTTLLATRAPILVAPAMNANMFTHPATQANIETLRQRGCVVVGPDSGRQACGTVGPGRLIDPATILEAAFPLLSERRELRGKKVLITSGGTHEPLDPVRFIGNRSSGKMGRALAEEAFARGAEVTVVTGPHTAEMPHVVETIEVETAVQMAEAVAARASDTDIFIAAAAVADYRPEGASEVKHKKNGESLMLSLAENPDILATFGAQKSGKQLVVGFAAETNDLLANAKEKLNKKNLDLIVANEVGTSDSGFGLDDLRAAIIGTNGHVPEFALHSKESLAESLFDRIGDLLK